MRLVLAEIKESFACVWRLFHTWVFKSSLGVPLKRPGVAESTLALRLGTLHH